MKEVKELIKDEIPTFMDSKEFRPLAYVLKGEIDEENSIKIFLEIDGFVRTFALKYFKQDKT
jgi:hypothetical protein